jgi:prepilin-type N-terminal cleavage/methylation domain-containing protein
MDDWRPWRFVVLSSEMTVNYLGSEKQGLSLLELMAAVAILALLAVVIVPRLTGHRDSANRNTCHVQRGEIELEVQRWRTDTGSYPAADLSDIGADADYFPDSLPTCPVDDTTYTIDTTDGLVIGHDH